MVVFVIIFGLFVIIFNIIGIEIKGDWSLVECFFLIMIFYFDLFVNIRILVIIMVSLVGGFLVGLIVGFIGGVYCFF